MSAAVLEVQELCDHITDFLLEDDAHLKTCALISRTFTRSAQYHLFHDIILTPGCTRMDDPSIYRHNDMELFQDFCSLLSASPHLVQYVRRLRIRLAFYTLQELREFEFLNLLEIVFHRVSDEPTRKEIVPLAARMVGLPLVRKVSLLGVNFHEMRDLGQLFSNATPNLVSLMVHKVDFPSADIGPGHNTPRLRIKALMLASNPVGYHTQDFRWLHHPQSPFDCSQLVDVDFGRDLIPSVLTHLSAARLTIQRLSFNIENTSNLRLNLTHFPALKIMEIVVTLCHMLQNIVALLEPGLSGVEVLVLKIYRSKRPLAADLFHSLDTTISAKLPRPPSPGNFPSSVPPW
ncbi:hypothetical protein C8J57DRAFT_1724694 [Mycena rebaudengoi]|nr:hypothetical protein C8J57DRAFT_1724694 [Mycena rebaudengoi]